MQITEDAVKDLCTSILDALKSNTRSGIDRAGERFKPYSERPFWMPYGAIYDKWAFWNYENSNSDKVSWSHKYYVLGVVWKGGYKDYKGVMLQGKTNTDIVDLTFTGAMLESLVFNYELKDNNSFKIELLSQEVEIPLLPTIEITIYFDDDEQALKAQWNYGKGRDFMGLPEDILSDVVGKWLDKI